MYALMLTTIAGVFLFWKKVIWMPVIPILAHIVVGLTFLIAGIVYKVSKSDDAEKPTAWVYGLA